VELPFETEFMGNIGRGEPGGQMVYASGAYCQFYAKCHACDGQKRVEAAIEEVMRGEVEPTAPLLHSSLSQRTEYGRVDE
jgi:hypothetical protein